MLLLAGTTQVDFAMCFSRYAALSKTVCLLPIITWNPRKISRLKFPSCTGRSQIWKDFPIEIMQAEPKIPLRWANLKEDSFSPRPVMLHSKYITTAIASHYCYNPRCICYNFNLDPKQLSKLFSNIQNHRIPLRISKNKLKSNL